MMSMLVHEATKVVFFANLEKFTDIYHTSGKFTTFYSVHVCSLLRIFISKDWSTCMFSLIKVTQDFESKVGYNF